MLTEEQSQAAFGLLQEKPQEFSQEWRDRVIQVGKRLKLRRTRDWVEFEEIASADDLRYTLHWMAHDRRRVVARRLAIGAWIASVGATVIIFWLASLPEVEAVTGTAIVAAGSAFLDWLVLRG